MPFFQDTCYLGLGHIISDQGVEPDKAKLASVAQYPTPHTSKKVKQFIGLSNYYRCFIPSYAEIAEPLHRHLRKTNKGFNWTSECDSAFNILKTKLTTPPVLRFGTPFIVATDALDYAIGGRARCRTAKRKSLHIGADNYKKLSETTLPLNVKHLLWLMQ